MMKVMTNSSDFQEECPRNPLWILSEAVDQRFDPSSPNQKRNIRITVRGLAQRSAMPRKDNAIHRRQTSEEPASSSSEWQPHANEVRHELISVPEKVVAADTAEETAQGTSQHNAGTKNKKQRTSQVESNRKAGKKKEQQQLDEELDAENDELSDGSREHDGSSVDEQLDLDVDDEKTTGYETVMTEEPTATRRRGKIYKKSKRESASKEEANIHAWIQRLLEHKRIGHRACTLDLQKMSQGRPLSIALSHLKTVILPSTGKVEPGAALFLPFRKEGEEAAEWDGKSYLFGVILRMYTSGEIGEVMYFPFGPEEADIVQYPKDRSPFKDGARIEIPLGSSEKYLERGTADLVTVASKAKICSPATGKQITEALLDGAMDWPSSGLHFLGDELLSLNTRDGTWQFTYEYVQAVGETKVVMFESPEREDAMYTFNELRMLCRLDEPGITLRPQQDVAMVLGMVRLKGAVALKMRGSRQAPYFDTRRIRRLEDDLGVPVMSVSTVRDSMVDLTDHEYHLVGSFGGRLVRGQMQHFLQGRRVNCIMIEFRRVPGTYGRVMNAAIDEMIPVMREHDLLAKGCVVIRSLEVGARAHGRPVAADMNPLYVATKSIWPLFKGGEGLEADTPFQVCNLT